MTFKEARYVTRSIWYGLEVQFSDGTTTWVSDVSVGNTYVNGMFADADVLKVDDQGSIWVRVDKNEDAIREWAEYECADFGPKEEWERKWRAQEYREARYGIEIPYSKNEA